VVDCRTHAEFEAKVVGGVLTSAAIPDAKLRWIEGMGHDLPRGAWPLLIDLIVRHAQDASTR